MKLIILTSIWNSRSNIYVFNILFKSNGYRPTFSVGGFPKTKGKLNTYNTLTLNSGSNLSSSFYSKGRVHSGIPSAFPKKRTKLVHKSMFYCIVAVVQTYTYLYLTHNSISHCFTDTQNEASPHLT